MVLSVAVSGDPEPAVMWYHEGNKLGPEHAREIPPYHCLQINITDYMHSGIYRMYARNSGGTAMSEFQLLVRDPGDTSVISARLQNEFDRSIEITEQPSEMMSERTCELLTETDKTHGGRIPGVDIELPPSSWSSDEDENELSEKNI